MEVGSAALVHDAWADHVLDPQAVDVDQPAARAQPAVALLPRDQHADQAQGFGVGGVDIGPTGMTLDGEPQAPPRAHPAAGELAFGRAGVGFGGDVPNQGDHLCGPQAKGTAISFGVRPVARSARNRSSSSSPSMPASFMALARAVKARTVHPASRSPWGAE